MVSIVFFQKHKVVQKHYLKINKLDKIIRNISKNLSLERYKRRKKYLKIIVEWSCPEKRNQFCKWEKWKWNKVKKKSNHNDNEMLFYTKLNPVKCITSRAKKKNVNFLFIYFNFKNSYFNV